MATSCPALVFTLTYQNGDPIESDIFTFDAGQETLTTYNNDARNADTYNLRLTVNFSGSYYVYPKSTDFTMTLIDPCPGASISLVTSPWPLSDKIWTLGDNED